MYYDIHKIIPHKDPMVMIDGYQKIDDNSGIGEKTFIHTDYSIHNGHVIDSILIECIAQAVAAHSGYDSLFQKKTPNKSGMLVAVDSFRFFNRVKKDSKISIAVKKTNQIGSIAMVIK